LFADGSDLRKPYAKALPSLMKVRALDKSLVPGYRTLTVLGLTPQHRGVLYHRLFSSSAPDFVSEPTEVQTALQTVSQAITPLKVSLAVTWILDSGFDDVAVWRTIWEQDEHLVVRVAHPERLVDLPDWHGGWQPGNIDAARLYDGGRARPDPDGDAKTGPATRQTPNRACRDSRMSHPPCTAGDLKLSYEWMSNNISCMMNQAAALRCT
jgi:hypothetical protein